MGPEELCGNHQRLSRAFKIKSFVTEVMKLKFDEVPDYENLRFLLQKTLLDDNIVPSKHFDWLPQQ